MSKLGNWLNPPPNALPQQQSVNIVSPSYGGMLSGGLSGMHHQSGLANQYNQHLAGQYGQQLGAHNAWPGMPYPPITWEENVPDDELEYEPYPKTRVWKVSKPPVPHSVSFCQRCMFV